MFSFRRWRNTRGFGVHSPFGYDLAKRVVRPGKDYSFYGYPAVDAACAKDGCSHSVRPQARMLLRLATMLEIESAFLPKGIHPAFHAALKSSNAAMRIERRLKDIDGCRLLCAKADFIPIDTIKRHLEVSGNAVALLDIPENWADEIYDSMQNGIMIRGERNIIFIARDKMQKVAYDMSI